MADAVTIGDLKRLNHLMAGQEKNAVDITGGTISGVTFSGIIGAVTSINASGAATGLTFSGGPITSSGTLTLAGTLAIANGGTGQITANASLNALLPDQTGQSTKVLKTDGTNASWQTDAMGGTVTSVSVTTANGVSGVVATATTTPAITLTLGAITPLSVSAVGTVTGSNLSNTNTGDVTLAGENYLSRTNQVITANAVNLTGTNVTGQLKAASFPALTGDITTAGGALATTLATVNSNVGSFTFASITVNAKGLITAASSGANPVTSGSVTNTVQVAQTATATTTSTTFVNITGMSASITPSSTSDKVLVRAVLNIGALQATTAKAFVKVLRGSTDIFIGAAAGSRISASTAMIPFSDADMACVVIEFLDSPATASSVTYNIAWLDVGNVGIFLNRTATDTNTNAFPRAASSITLQTIKG